ncbi:MAG: hypothetical protein PHD48_03140 [Alphaproteobacteria bacterium]|nr:hypothetical protein [Alphaproteobacteria bacterium]
MFDAVMILSSIGHACVLIALLILACRKGALPVHDWPFLILLLLWGSLVFAGHGAGLLDKLNTLSVYIPATLVGVGIMSALFLSLAKIPASPPLLSAASLSFTRIENPKIERFLWRFLLITLALFAVISVVLAMSVYPDNADSMIYRLPRTVWYVSHGNFLHPFTSPDNRLVYYPLDGVMLYVPLVLYNLPGTFHSIPSLISWTMVVYIAYRFARELGAQRVLALFSAWLVGLTPSILAQATSTNDEILASAVFFCALLMGWRWLVTGRHVYFFMAGLAIGLSAGTKLHIVFLMPIVAIALLLALWSIYKNPKLFSLWAQAIGWKTGAMTLALLLIMFAPFLLYNYVSVGRLYFFDDFKDQVFNLSASFQVGFQNLLIYTSQMIFSPLADMNFWPVANDRQRFNTAINQIFNPLIKPLIDTNPAYYHLNYRYVGVTIPVSVRFVEFSLWSAFVWLLWPFQAALSLKQKFSLRSLFFLFAITPLFWLVFWSFTTLYMEGTATYFTFYLICAAPASVMVFTKIRRPLINELRWVAVVLVTISNLVICHNLVMYSGFRALPDLYYAKTWPYDWLLTEKPIIDEIRSADRIRIMMTHEKLPYFGYMHWHPKATYYSPFDINGKDRIQDIGNVLQILPVSGLNLYGFMPIKVPGKMTPGLTYLGAVRAIGREAIFAVGNGVEKRHPTEADYILLQANILPNEKGEWDILFSKSPVGFSQEDQLTFEYILKSGKGEVIVHREADRNPGAHFSLRISPHDYVMNLTTIVRSAWNNKELTQTTYQLGGPGMWLPEGPEY